MPVILMLQSGVVVCARAHCCVSSCVMSLSPAPHWLLYDESVVMENVRLDISVVTPQTKTKIISEDYERLLWRIIMENYDERLLWTIIMNDCYEFCRHTIQIIMNESDEQLLWNLYNTWLKLTTSPGDNHKTQHNNN